MKRVLLSLLAAAAVAAAISCGGGRRKDEAKFHILQADGSWKETAIEISGGALNDGAVIPEVPSVKLEGNASASGIDFTADQTAIRADESWYSSAVCAVDDATFDPDSPSKGDWYPKYRLAAPAAVIEAADDIKIVGSVYNDSPQPVSAEITIALTDAQFTEMDAEKDVTGWFSIEGGVSLTQCGLAAKIKSKVDEGIDHATITIAGTTIIPEGWDNDDSFGVSVVVKADALIGGVGPLAASVQDSHTFTIEYTSSGGGQGDDNPPAAMH